MILWGTVGHSVSRAEVWLLQAPEYMQQCMWDIVVLAAVFAMETGRRFMAATRKGVPGHSFWPSSARVGDKPRGSRVLGVAAGVWIIGVSSAKMTLGGLSLSVLAGGVRCAGVRKGCKS